MAEDSCNCSIFPKCPKCDLGVLLPFSFKEDVFEKWKCSNPKCDVYGINWNRSNKIRKITYVGFSPIEIRKTQRVAYKAKW